jgi:hypothetical protein
LDSRIYDWQKLNRLVREPQNTVSNLAYVTLGLAVILSGRRKPSLGFCLGCIFLGLGSGLYHASLLPEWRMIDILGVYVTLFALVGTGVAARLSCFSWRWDAAIACMAWVLAVPAGIWRNDVRIWNFKILDSTYVVLGAIFVIVGLVLGAWRKTTDTRRFAVLALTMALSGAIAGIGGWADRFGHFLANPNGWIQGHSVWHLLGALGLGCAYEIFCLTGFDRSVFESHSISPEPHFERSVKQTTHKSMGV